MTLVTIDYSIAIFTSVRGKQNIQANLKSHIKVYTVKLTHISKISHR